MTRAATGQKWCSRSCLWFLFSTLFLSTFTGGCGRETETLVLATAVTLQDSGLLDQLVPKFREQTGIAVKVISVGTGQAIQIGRRGDADVLLVHDPAAEQEFMYQKHGSLRLPVMHNDFVLLGPAANPAEVERDMSIAQAFQQIAKKHGVFVSRGDESGTHQKERAIWKKARIEPQGGWYISAGTGMEQILRMAAEKQAYTLSDRSTYLSLRQGLDLVILSEGDALLLNQYSVIVINPEKHANVHDKAARQFVDFIRSEPIQKFIGEFGKEKLGQPLFFPDAN